MRRLLILGVVVLMAASLAACGRKGSPKVPDDAVYPRVYPYTPLPEQPAAVKPPTDGTATQTPFEAPQPRRTMPDELKPPAGDTETRQ